MNTELFNVNTIVNETTLSWIVWIVYRIHTDAVYSLTVYVLQHAINVHKTL